MQRRFTRVVQTPVPRVDAAPSTLPPRRHQHRLVDRAARSTVVVTYGLIGAAITAAPGLKTTKVHAAETRPAQTRVVTTRPPLVTPAPAAARPLLSSVVLARPARPVAQAFPHGSPVEGPAPVAARPLLPSITLAKASQAPTAALSWRPPLKVAQPRLSLDQRVASVQTRPAPTRAITYRPPFEIPAAPQPRLEHIWQSVTLVQAPRLPTLAQVSRIPFDTFVPAQPRLNLPQLTTQAPRPWRSSVTVSYGLIGAPITATPELKATSVYLTETRPALTRIEVTRPPIEIPAAPQPYLHRWQRVVTTTIVPPRTATFVARVPFDTFVPPQPRLEHVWQTVVTVETPRLPTSVLQGRIPLVTPAPAAALPRSSLIVQARRPTGNRGELSRFGVLAVSEIEYRLPYTQIFKTHWRGRPTMVARHVPPPFDTFVPPQPYLHRWQSVELARIVPPKTLAQQTAIPFPPPPPQPRLEHVWQTVVHARIVPPPTALVVGRYPPSPPPPQPRLEHLWQTVVTVQPPREAFSLTKITMRFPPTPRVGQLIVREIQGLAGTFDKDRDVTGTFDHEKNVTGTFDVDKDVDGSGENV